MTSQPSSPPDLTDLGFGRVFTDHMVTSRWTPGEGWGPVEVQKRTPLALDPAATVLHYGQAVFEDFDIQPTAAGLRGGKRLPAARPASVRVGTVHGEGFLRLRWSP